VRLRAAASEHQDAWARQAHGGCGCESPCALTRRAALLLCAHAALAGRDIIDEALEYFRANVLYRKYDVKGTRGAQPAQPAPARD
jgi:hypothetical protein